ncbi:MAG TPA: carboxymuconolactone decarboxylase family protein [Acidimicrobiia bacterium]|nr:carboxymuconolactone decarboxylase family protein [Acidimicrobiia bacterium]
MSDYLPDVYLDFRDRAPTVATALDQLGRATEAAGPLDPRTQRLVKLGIAIGALAEGAVRSNVRKALEEGASPEDIRHAVMLAITTVGFPASVAALGWIDEVLDRSGSR